MKNPPTTPTFLAAVSMLLLIPHTSSAATNIVDGTFFITYNTGQPNWQGIAELSGTWSFEYDDPDPAFDGNVLGVNVDFDSLTVGGTNFDSSNVTATINFDPGQLINTIALTGGSVGNDSADYIEFIYGGFAGEIGQARISSASVPSNNIADNPSGPFGSTSSGSFTVTPIPEPSTAILGLLGAFCIGRRKRS